MRKRMIQYIGLLLVLLMAGASIPPAIVSAASAEAELSAEKEEVKVGEEFFVYLTVSSNSEFGDFEANLTYDESVLEYQGGSSKVKGGSGFLKISDREVTEGTKQRKYTMKFEAVEVGICNLAFNEGSQIMVYDMGDSNVMSVSSNTLSINVAASETASSNTKLKDLQISPSSLTPEFNPEVYEYSTEVEYDTEKLIIVAIPEDDKATVTITGNDKLQEGQNKITIQVLAESGADIEYIINANRKTAPMVTGPAVTEMPDDGKYGNFEIIREEDGKYAVYSGKYKLLEPDSSVVIPEGYVKTKMILSDVSVTAFYPENDFGSDFLLLYAENELGEVGFYQYDKIERTIQRYRSGISRIVNEDNDTTTQDLITSEKYRTNLNRAAIVIALLCAVCALLITLLLRSAIKGRGYKEDDLE